MTQIRSSRVGGRLRPKVLEREGWPCGLYTVSFQSCRDGARHSKPGFRPFSVMLRVARGGLRHSPQMADFSWLTGSWEWGIRPSRGSPHASTSDPRRLRASLALEKPDEVGALVARMERNE